jgi:hypothetical protein
MGGVSLSLPLPSPLEFAPPGALPELPLSVEQAHGFPRQTHISLFPMPPPVWQHHSLCYQPYVLPCVCG